MQEQSSEPETRPARSRGRWGRVILFGLGGLVLVLVVVVALLPMILSTGPGTRALTELVQRFSDYVVQIDSLNLSWRSGQSVRELSVRPVDESWSMRADRIDMPRYGLLSAATGSLAIGPLHSGHIHFAQAEPVAEPEEPADPDEPSPDQDLPEIPEGLEVNFSAERLTYETPDQPTVELRNVNLTADLSDRNHLQMGLSAELQQGEQVGGITGQFSLQDAYDDRGRPQLAEGQLEARANLNNVPVPAVDRILEQEGQLQALLGPVFNGELTARGPIEDLTANLVAESERLQADMSLARVGDQLQMREGSAASVQVTPQLYQRYTGATEQDARLAQPFMVNLEIAKLAMPRPSADLSVAEALNDLTADATVTAGQIEMALPGQGPVAVSGLELGVQTARLAEQVTAQLNGQLALDDSSGPVTASATVNKPLSSRRHGTLEAQQLPVVLADALAGQQGRLVATLGQALDVTLAAEPRIVEEAHQGYTLQGQLSSPQLQAAMSGRYEPSGILRLQTDQPLTLSLTAEAVNQWLTYAEQGAVVQAAGPMSLSAEVEHLALALAEKGGLDGAESGMIATLEIAPTPFVDPDTGRRHNLGGTFELAGQNLRQRLEAVIELIVQGASPDGEAISAGQVKGDATLTELLNEAGRLEPGGAQLVSNLSLTNVPSSFIDVLAGQNGALAAVLGQHTSGQVALDYQAGNPGSASAKVRSDNVASQIRAAIDPKQVLTLNEDATLAVDVNEQTSEALLRQINPMLGAAVSSREPLTLTLRQQDFRLPLAATSIERVTANAHLGQNELTLQREGLAGSVLGLLQKLNVLSPRQELKALISEVNMTLSEGVLTYDRLGLAFDGVELAFDGQINLASNQLDMGMSFAGQRLPGELRGTRVPISGTIQNPQMDEGDLLRGGVEQLFRRGVDEGLGELLGGQRNGGNQQQQKQQRQQENGQQQREGQPGPFDLLRQLGGDNEDENQQQESQ
jgi:hypothetical protein